MALAGNFRSLKDRTGNAFFPICHVKGMYFDDGSTVDQREYALQTSVNNMVHKQEDEFMWQNVIKDNNLDIMIIDVLLDSSNINNTLSTTYKYIDYTLQTSSTSTIVFNKYTNDIVPSNICIVADTTINNGSMAFYTSRNGGTTFTKCNANELTNITSQPSGKDIVLKVVITGNAILNAIGYGWK